MGINVDVCFNSDKRKEKKRKKSKNVKRKEGKLDIVDEILFCRVFAIVNLFWNF